MRSTPDADPQIGLSLSTRRSTATLELCGEFDLAAEADFDERIRDALSTDCDHLVIDLRALEFIDSTGLKLLLKLDALSRQDGFRLWVVNGHGGEVQNALRTTGLDVVLPLVDRPPDLPD